eukprot:8244143-Lingulodinium_polyedra.AAC.1
MRHQADKVVEGLPMDLQLKLRSVAGKLDGEDGLNCFLEHLSLLRGERPGDERRKALRAAFYNSHTRR